MSQLPDIIYVPKAAKYGTLDYVTAYLDLEAAKESRYEKDEMQKYIPTYRLQEFVKVVEEMRALQKVYTEMFPTGYGCYAPIEMEQKVDACIQDIKKMYPKENE